MEILVDAHGNKLTVHLLRKEMKKYFIEIFRRACELTHTEYRLLRLGGIWAQRKNHFPLPRLAFAIKLPQDFPYSPCLWYSSIREFAPLLVQWLCAQNIHEILYVFAPHLTPQKVQTLPSGFAKIKLHPLELYWVLPDPPPPLEITEDIEQLYFGMPPIEGSLETAALTYLRYLRFELRRISEGFFTFLNRLTIYHMLLDMHRYFRLEKIVPPLFVEQDAGVRRLRIIATSDDAGVEERCIAAGILSRISAIAAMENPTDYNLPINKERLLGYVRALEGDYQI